MGPDPSVETRFGRLRGSAENGVRVFRGVPYARPPVGPLRFAAPRPPEPWTGIREAREFGPPAPQPPGMNTQLMGYSAEASSEDCLTLNLWTPATDAVRRPIMVWIHGGSFATGTGALPVYDGSSLARRGDVVVVTLNYRLGALGFLCFDDDPREEGDVSANFGIHDLVAALEWLQEHAPVFGGDPGCVTLFGESAGAMAIAALLGAPRARGLFHRGILQSGAAENVSSIEEGAKVRGQLMNELGLAADDRKALGEVPVPVLLDAQNRATASLGRSLNGLAFQPVLDGELLTRRPLEAIETDAAPRVELLVGTNRDEQRFWLLNDEKARRLDEAGLMRRLSRNLSPGTEGSPLAERVARLYRRLHEARGHSLHPRELWFAIETDRLFRAPALRLAEHHAARGGAVFHYLFTWASSALEGVLGSCHAMELPFVFGTTGHPAVRVLVGGAAEEAERLSETVQDAWAAFARHGDPSHQGLGEWAAYQASRRATRVLGPGPVLEDDHFEEIRALWDSIPTVADTSADPIG